MKIHLPVHSFTINIIMMIFIGTIMMSSCGKSQEDLSEKTMGKPQLQEPSKHGETENKGRNPTSETSDTAIKIGVVGAHSGEFSSYGLPSLNAVKMVVDELNHKGGFLGKKIKVVTIDDACNPDVAAVKAEHMVSEKVMAVIGHTCSAATLSALPVYNKSRILCISPSSTNADLTLSGKYPWFFRTVANDKVQTKVQADFSIHKLHAQKAAILYAKDDYGKGMASFAREYFDESGLVTVVLFEGIEQGFTDFSTIVEKIKKSGADLVVWEGYYPEASLLIKQMRLNRLKSSFIGSDGIKNDQFITDAGKWAEGVYVSGPQNAGRNIISIKVMNDYKARFGSEPGPFFINAYSAAMAITNAMIRSGSTDCETLANMLRSENVDTPLGRISFDEKGDVVGTGFSVYQIKAEAFKEL